MTRYLVWTYEGGQLVEVAAGSERDMSAEEVERMCRCWYPSRRRYRVAVEGPFRFG